MKKTENTKETMELIYFPGMEMLESSNSMFMIEDKDGESFYKVTNVNEDDLAEIRRALAKNKPDFDILADVINQKSNYLEIDDTPLDSMVIPMDESKATEIYISRSGIYDFREGNYREEYLQGDSEYFHVSIAPEYDVLKSDEQQKTTQVFEKILVEKEPIKQMENNKEYQKHLDAVKRYGVLISVPEELKTKEICNIAVEKHGDNLQYVPEKLKTPELCKLAISEYGWALEYVPEEYKTPELCKLAVEKSSWVLQIVPEELKSFEICEIAVKESVNAIDASKWDPLHIITKYVPEEFQEELAEKYDIDLPEKYKGR